MNRDSSEFGSWPPYLTAIRSRASIRNNFTPVESNFGKWVRTSVASFSYDSWTTLAFSRGQIAVLADGAHAVAQAILTEAVLFIRVLLAFALSSFLVAFGAEVLVSGAGARAADGPTPPRRRTGQVHDLLAIVSSVEALIAFALVSFLRGQVEEARAIVFAGLQVADGDTMDANISRITLAFVSRCFFNTSGAGRTSCAHTGSG
jgi:hypothetical protein